MNIYSKLPIRFKVFIFSFCSVFLMVGIPHLGFQFPKTSFNGVVSPLPKQEDSLKKYLS